MKNLLKVLFVAITPTCHAMLLHERFLVKVFIDCGIVIVNKVDRLKKHYFRRVGKEVYLTGIDKHDSINHYRLTYSLKEHFDFRNKDLK